MLSWSGFTVCVSILNIFCSWSQNKVVLGRSVVSSSQGAIHVHLSNTEDTQRFWRSKSGEKNFKLSDILSEQRKSVKVFLATMFLLISGSPATVSENQIKVKLRVIRVLFKSKVAKDAASKNLVFLHVLF